MSVHSTKISAIDQLAGISNLFGKDFTEKKWGLLIESAGIRLNNVKQIKRYHDVLLFLISYPENAQIYQLALDKMKRLSEAINHFTPSKKEQLTNSGIAFTETQGTFSFVIMKWLLANFPGEISIHSFDETGAHPKVLLKHVLNEMEFELIGDESLSKLKWLEKVSGFKKKPAILKWLINGVDELPLEPVLKEELFESLKLFISICSEAAVFSRSFGRIKISEWYLHGDGLLKKFNEADLINKKLPAEKKLNTKDKEDVLKTARIALILLNRETDPITYGDTDGIKFFDLEHGLSIALFSMRPQFRFALESYIGFMMFKNGHPMAYGGAWLFVRHALIGINIFEAFRGGESAFVFAQLLRTYKQAFGAEYFEVEPYQFGKNNPEGLRSGAFWFYHRFGFRPVDDRLSQLAEQEHQKIIQNKSYRSPIGVLKQFTKSNLAVNFGTHKTFTKPSQISHFVTDRIAGQFMGDRKSAFKWSQEVLKKELGLNYSGLTETERFGFKKLSVIAALCFDFRKMSPSDKKTLNRLIKEKGSSEFAYILSLHQFPFEKYFVQELLDFKVK